MSAPTIDDLDSDILRSVIEHVFMPPQLPQKHPGVEMERKTNVALCNCLIEAAQDFLPIVPSSESSLWMHMIKMVELARRAAKAPFTSVELRRALTDMTLGDVLSMHIRAQNAALIVRRLTAADLVQFEVFEVLPLISAVMKTEGKLLCSYPGPAIRIPADIFTDECFLQELSSFLVQMDVDNLDSTLATDSANRNRYDAPHPRYILELLAGILRGYGEPAAINRITKRIGDEVLLDMHEDHKPLGDPWRRSPLWLILKVSLQSSLLSGNLYKHFILFFHAHLLCTCVRRDFPSELLYIMRVKIARRLSKLGPAVSHDVSKFVHDTAKATETLLSKRWIAFQDAGSINPPLQLKGLDFVTDTQISLDNSYNYLTKILRSASSDSTQSWFTPSSLSRLYNIQDFSQFANGKLAKSISEDKCIAILDFELSVERNLESWISSSTNNDDSFNVITSCIDPYLNGMKYFYATNAEDISVMVLTTMDLWVALDRLAIQACPLLKEYSPEIPSDFLHCLLLHRSPDLKRALHIEEYLCRRHKEALDVPSIFSNSVRDSSFAVKYFRTSEDLQRLYHRIYGHAQKERIAKREELAYLKERSKSLLDEASKTDHTQIEDSFGRERHSLTCLKCQLENQAEALKIRVHEWPLPPSMVHAQLAVFELSPPRVFSVWRDITYTIVRDIGLHSVSHPCIQPLIDLDSYSGLQHWVVDRQQRRRVTLASTTPSFSDEMVNIHAEESSILIDNPLSFMLLDRIHASWVIESLSKSSTAEFCVPFIPPSSPYNQLYRFISGTEHTPNDIIAAQADCPQDISLQEFIAFAGLRNGPRLQWLNITRELASPFLSFNRDEVHKLITQAAWQLGPLSNGVREWHIDLSCSSFGNALLCEIECLLEKIKANWLEEVTTRTIVLICSRLLASAIDQDISLRACALLREARDVTYQWVGQVRMKLGSMQDETSHEKLKRRLCMLAATCFSIFGVCSEHVPATLATEEDFSIAMQCAVIVYDNKPSFRSYYDDDARCLAQVLCRHDRLLHRLEPIFSQSVHGQARLLYSGAYGDALAQLRPGYRQGNSSTWHALPGPNSRWIYCILGEGQRVHYDLLTGKLITGGKHMRTLPQTIVMHPAYASVFGTRILDVFPADIDGMEYIAPSAEPGCQIVFSWNNGNLILQARYTVDSRILQLIPRSELIGDFPRHLIDEYVHWLDLSLGELEFRPAGSPWMSEPSNWRLHIQRPGIPEQFEKPDIHPRAVLRRPSQDGFPIQVIDIRSHTFAVVSSLLSPLESPEYIIATHTVQSLDISLPRLRLSFFVNTNRELECRSMPGYVVDTTQSCGTMFGLRNKLVLCPRPSTSEQPLFPRRVIIPQGEISFETNGGFNSVFINTGTKHHVRWHEYTIDTDLRCLTSNSSLSSRLYQCYLHALTSHCLPDPLLGHMGTEEALYILRSAACRSFQRLDDYQKYLLTLISNLSPDRVISAWLTTQVKWNELPVLSQHHDFFLAVLSICDHAVALEASVGLYPIDRDRTLLNRAAFRNKSYYPADLHISGQPPSSYDLVIRSESRDVYDDNSAEYVAYRTSWSIWNDRPSVDEELWDVMTSWGSVGVDSNWITSLRYSRYWFKIDAAEDWFLIYDLCRKEGNGNRRNLKIELSFSLSAAAYSSVKNSNAIQFLIIIALDERSRNFSPPSKRSDVHPSECLYTLSHGLTPDLATLKNILTTSALPLSSTLAYSKVEGTSALELSPALEAEYHSVIDTASSAVANSILHEWPDYKSVDIPPKWFDISQCIQRIEKYSQSIIRNIRLREHVLQLQTILQDYQNMSKPVAIMPYAVLSPESITSHSKAPSYSLHHTLASRVNVPTPSTYSAPFQCRVIPPAEVKADVPSRAASESLEILVDELRRSSRPLRQLYGNELNKSHRELSGKNASQFQFGRDDVPSHEALLVYYKECSNKKDKLFSDISAALAPSREMEEINSIAGLWPRITPRSILRQLAQDHISTLPDHWELVITQYAVSFIRYQQSLRLVAIRKNIL